MADRNFSDYLGVQAAADVLGVSASTVRNWTDSGKLPAHRHPVNGYRLYDPQDLDDLLARIRAPQAHPGRQASSKAARRRKERA